jgi:hypothetical protein
MTTQPAPLTWDVYVTALEPTASDDPPPGAQQFLLQPIAATLISGQEDAVLVDPLLTVDQARDLADWVAAHGTIQSLGPRAVIAGHQRTGRHDGPEIIEETRQYVRDFDRIVETTETARALYDQMLAIYPERVNPGMLWWSARALKP